MPRQSSAARAVLRVDGQPTQLEPPPGLERRTAAVFARLAASTPRGHLMASDVPLVVEYCRAVLMAERADRELRRGGPVVGGKPSPWLTVQEKSVRAMTALSLRLRLAPQARQDPKTAHRHAQRSTTHAPPWGES
jgi:phage terminase small subunit